MFLLISPISAACSDPNHHFALVTAIPLQALLGGGAAHVSRCLLPRLREQAQQLVRCQPQEAKHEVGHHLGVASDPDLLATEFILEPRIRALSLAAFLVALLLRRVKLDLLAPARGL